MVDVFARDGRFDYKSANNGFDAGMMVKESRPDVVVLDVMLPDINGKEVCQRVRSDPTMSSVKIICISGMVEQDKIADLRAAGADDFIHKPFTVEKLMERACEMLETMSPSRTSTEFTADVPSTANACVCRSVLSEFRICIILLSAVHWQKVCEFCVFFRHASLSARHVFL